MAKDPALAILQIQNEDSLFFWTLGAVKPAQMDLLGQKFAGWLIKKYETLAKAQKAWDNYSIKGDKFEEGKIALLSPWHMTQALEGGAGKRLRDQIRFLADTQRDFYAEITSYFRDDLGCKATHQCQQLDHC